MENDYKSQQSNNELSMTEMEKRMVDLRSNLERLQQTKQKLEEENNHLSRTNEQIQLQVWRIWKIFFREFIFLLASRSNE